MTSVSSKMRGEKGERIDGKRVSVVVSKMLKDEIIEKEAELQQAKSVSQMNFDEKVRYFQNAVTNYNQKENIYRREIQRDERFDNIIQQRIESVKKENKLLRDANYVLNKQMNILESKQEVLKSKLMKEKYTVDEYNTRRNDLIILLQMYKNTQRDMIGDMKDNVVVRDISKEEIRREMKTKGYIHITSIDHRVKEKYMDIYKEKTI